MRIQSIISLFILSLLLKTSPLTAQDLTLEWVKHVSGPGQELGSSIAIDHDENIFVVGSFQDTIEVNTINGIVELISKGKEDMFVLKTNTVGDILWCKHIGGKGSLGGSAEGEAFQKAFFSIDADVLGNIYITGEFKDTVDFDPGEGEDIRHTVYYELDTGDPEMGGFIKDNYENTFLLKLNNDGDFQWVRTFSGKPNSAYAITIDNRDSSVFIAGRFQDTIDVNERKGTDLLISSHLFDIIEKPPYDAFIVKFNWDGDFVWARQIGNNGKSNEAYGIHATENGSLYITGQYTSLADFNFGFAGGQLSTLNPNGIGTNIFVSKFDINGNYVWAKGMGSLNNNRSTRGSAITTDPSGNILLTGFYQGIGIFDPNNFNNTNAQVTNISRTNAANAGLSCFVAKLDSNGAFIWAKGLNSTYVDHGTAIATDSEGNVYTIGYFGGQGDFNPNHNPPHNLNTGPRQNVINTFISKLDSNGNHEWARSIYGGYNRGQDIIVSPGRDVYITGFFNETADFNHLQGSARELTAKGNWDAYVMKLSCMEKDSLVLTDEVCANEYELNGEIYEMSGRYRQRFQNVTGCDSIVVLNLTLNKIPKPFINVDEFELRTTEPYATYQWLLNGNIIQDATSRMYKVLENGDYSVVVTTDEGCIDTSDIYEVTNIVGIGRTPQLASLITVYPNPAKNVIFIQAPFKINVTVRTIEGRIIRQIENADRIPVEEWADGLYLLYITDSKGTFLKTEKIVKVKTQ